MTKLLDLLNAAILFWEREAGYNLTCLGLIIVGVWLVDAAMRPQVAHDLIVFGTGVLARSMGAKLKTPEAK